MEKIDAPLFFFSTCIYIKRESKIVYFSFFSKRIIAMLYVPINLLQIKVNPLHIKANFTKIMEMHLKQIHVTN